MSSTTEPVSDNNDLCKVINDNSSQNGINKIYNDRMVSCRAKKVIDVPSVTVKYNQKVGSDLYHPQNNPKGYVDFGSAENKLCEDMISEKLKTLPDDSDDVELRYYPDMTGLPSFRKSLGTFIQRQFNSIHDIHASDIAVAAGVTTLFDCLAFAIAEHGDYFMTTSPYYYRIKNDVGERAGVNILEVPLNTQPGPNGEVPYTLDISTLESALLTARSEGKNVKGFILVNPNNPLGSVCTSGQVNDVLQFCHKYKLHVILDEIYGLAVYDPDVTFTSVLSLQHPDPQRTHFLWGFSKDFGLSGYRAGVIWTKNKDVRRFLTSVGHFHLTPPLVQMRLKHMIDDTEWFNNIYKPTLQSRLRHHYKVSRDLLEECGAQVIPAYGGLFIWVNLTKFLSEQTASHEMCLFEKFMAEKVFLLPGQCCHSKTSGYFRLVFALDHQTLEEGLRRIKVVLKKADISRVS